MIYQTKTWICDNCHKVQTETFSTKYSEIPTFNDPTLINNWVVNNIDNNEQLICDKCLENIKGEKSE